MERNLIKIGDCREVLRGFEKECFNLIIADPPYRIKSWKGFGSKHDKSYNIEPPAYSEWIPHCFGILKPDGSIFIFENPANIGELWSAMKNSDFIIQPPLCWFVNFRKSHPRKGWYNNHWEIIMWGTKTDKWYFDNKPLRGGGSRYGGDVYEAPAIMRAKVPGQKPLKLIERLIAVHTKEGDMVLDPFAGSGTVGVAAQNLGRRYYLIEINPELLKIIDERLQPPSNISEIS